MGRSLALVGSLALICLLAFLTLSVAFKHGVDPLVLVSLLVLALLAVGVIGALNSPPND